MKYLRWLLFPFSLLYGLVVIIRNWCYDSGIFKSHRFDKPILSVGNLDVGGAGKSPMVEYLIRLLKDNYKLATLSRGYGRATTGYVVADAPGVSRVSNVSRVSDVSSVSSVSNVSDVPVVSDDTPDTTSQVGDEPAQFKHKFPDITVAVCEKRVDGIKSLLPDHNLILLDDAFQHRAVEAGLSILLFDYSRVNEPDFLLPAGNLREPFSGRWRAQIIVVSKCPPQLTTDEQQRIANKIGPLPYQQLFYTSIAYQGLQDMAGKPVEQKIDNDTTVFLLTGIANAEPLVKHLYLSTAHIIHHKYPDHHQFTIKNITKLAGEYGASASQKKVIITTEKDARRLEKCWLDPELPHAGKLPVCVIPIQTEFLDRSGLRFDQLITDYVRTHTTNNRVH